MDEVVKWTFSLGRSIASKAIVDKIEIPEKYYREVDNKFSELEKWSQMVSNLEPDKPHTWFHTGVDVLRELSVPMEVEGRVYEQDPFSAFAEENDLERRRPNDTDATTYELLNDIRKKVMSESVELISNDQGVLMAHPFEELENDFYFFFPKSDEDSRGNELEHYFLPEDPEERVNLFTKLASIFWEDKKIIRAGMPEDQSNKDSFVEEIDFDGREYEGPLTELYDTLSKYIENDTRRCILFQGPPGTGKSTLAYNLAERISGRTVVLTHDFLRSVYEEEWIEFMNIFQPEMILVDDIDRCAHQVESNLELFEERYCMVPLIVFTSNHYGQLPAAFKRPGRVDQIVKMQDPPESVRREVIKSLADQEDVEIPEDKFPILDMIYQEYPGAYIVELLRRCDVEGWDYEIPEYGLTFEKLSDDIIKAWNGEIDVEEVEKKAGGWEEKFGNNQNRSMDDLPEEYKRF